jgi:hypothetical protein
MPTKRKRILVSFTPEEKADVKMKADQFYTSISEFLRGLILGHRICPNRKLSSIAKPSATFSR